MFVIDHIEKVPLINHKKFATFFYVTCHKPYCYWHVGIQECFVIYC